MVNSLSESAWNKYSEFKVNKEQDVLDNYVYIYPIEIFKSKS